MNFRSARFENIGHFYSRLVYLMMRHPTLQGTSPPIDDDDEKHQVRQVLNKLNDIGPSWVDERKDLLDTPGGFNFSRLTWKRIFGFAGDLDDDMDDPAEARSKTGDAARGAQNLKRRRIADEN